MTTKKTASKKSSKKAAKKNATKPVATKEPRITVASVARELIKAGKSNEEVWAVIQPQFKLDDKKRHYPSWYRSELKRSK